MRCTLLRMSLALLLVVGLVSSPAEAQNQNQEAEAPRAEERPLTPEETLRLEIEQLLNELHMLRQEVAQARLEAEQARREADELRQFVEDHDEYGPAFEEYQAIREIALREQRRREADAARERREAERADRAQRFQEARAERERERAEARERRRMRDAGFTHVGSDVYVGKTSYFYAAKERPDVRYGFDPLFGFYPFYQIEARPRLDYSSLTISGSVINASDEVRNVGVAVTFFDRRGNQVGQETIHITNARPHVPYPFTSEVTMALDGPFDSSTAYVLYADPIDAPPAGP